MGTGKYIFDGTANSYMTTGFDLVLDPTAYSIIWKGRWNTGVVGYHTMFGGNASGVEISVNNDVLYVNWGGIGLGTWVNDGLEHTFVLRCLETENAQFYVDGVLEVTSGAPVASIVIPASRPLFIGAWQAGSQVLNGELSHAYFYSKKVTDQEITDVTANINNNPQTNLLLEYKNNKTTSTWTEEVGANNATNAGSVVFTPSTTTVKITWIDSISPGVIGHKVYRDDVEIADVGMGVQVWNDDTAVSGDGYKYEVQAYSSTNETTQESIGVNVSYGYERRFNESVYAVDAEAYLPVYNSGDATHQIIASNADWTTYINDSAKKHFFVQPGDYTSSLKTLTASGTALDRRTIQLYNGNNTHPAQLDLNATALAKVRLDIASDYWVVDRMAYWSDFTTNIAIVVTAGSNNIINRSLSYDTDGALITLYNGSDNNVIQNCRVENDTFRILNDRAAFGMSDLGLDNQACKNNVFVQNEVVNFVDGFQTIRSGAAQSVAFNCEGTIVDANLFMADNRFYTDGVGNHDPNGTNAYLENAIDLKSGSYNVANPMIITNNFMSGWRVSDQTGSNLNSSANAIVLHSEVPNTIIQNNILYDSSGGIGVAARNTFPFIMTNGDISNNIITKIQNTGAYIYDSNNITITGNLIKDSNLSASGNGWNLNDSELDPSTLTYTFTGNLTVNASTSIADALMNLTNNNNGWYNAPTNSVIHDASDTDHGSDPTAAYSDIVIKTDRLTNTARHITIEKVKA